MKDLLNSDYFWRSLYSLGFIVVALGLTGWVMRFFKERLAKDPGHCLSVHAGPVLDPKRRLVIIRWQQKEYLILVGSQGDHVIDQRPLAQEIIPKSPTPNPERMAPSFDKPFELTPYHAVS